jgi:hypothetical protein
LAKYIGLVDKASKVTVKAGQYNEATLQAQAEDGYNTKITGNHIEDNQKKLKNKKRDFQM